ncbi:MAG TPA: ABC transporter ATP-binding protein [Candidatus Andersenbacteria bacterium]|nr:ABC transporter ATP-binding protein [Candidatus Andersenbacteria bacterium]
MNVLRAYWPSVKKHWVLGITVSVLMIVGVCLSASPQYYVREIVNIFTSEKPDVAKAWKLFVNMLLIFVCVFITYRAYEFTLFSFEARVMRDLDIRSFSAIQRQSISFFENSFAGSLVKYVSRFKNAFEDIADTCLNAICRDFVILLVITVIFFRSMPSFAALFAVWAMIFLAISVVTAKWKYPIDKKCADEDSKVGGVIADSLGNHLTVKFFGNEHSEQARLNQAVRKNYDITIYSWTMSAVINALQAMMAIIGEVGLIWWMMRAWEKGAITAGDFVFFQMYVLWIIDHLWSIGRSVRRLLNCFAVASEMSNVFELNPEVRDAAGARPIAIHGGEIVFDNIGFQYQPPREGNFVIDRLDVRIPPGQSVGLVGKTGSGKSTLIRLLLRLSDVNSGSILIDSQDISMATQESIRQQIAVVSQPPQLFHRTIRENIAFGNPNASEDDIINAAKCAHAWEFIVKLPDGLNTIVGERGVKLSGGQQQRIAIARAILADAQIIIFDEATSSLDSETESFIQDSMAKLFSGRTSIVIAHRLSTIAKLDRILVMDNGRVVEDGTHQSLSRIPNGYYANLWKRQTERFLVD